MTQIIGHGGFAREVDCYITDVTNFFENEGIAQANPNLDSVLAIGDPATRVSIVKQYPSLTYKSILQGDIYDESTCKIGKGSIICPGSKITTNVTIGDFVIVNLNATIGHDAIVGDYTTVSPGANISGNVTIGKRCYIGSNSFILEKVTICDDVTIGAGAVVISDITTPGTYVGVPAQKTA